jgi:hypothetical protein
VVLHHPRVQDKLVSIGGRLNATWRRFGVLGGRGDGGIELSTLSSKVKEYDYYLFLLRIGGRG